MKNDPLGKLLSTAAIAAFGFMFITLLITLTGCGAPKTPPATPASTNSATAISTSTTTSDDEPALVAESTESVQTCPEFEKEQFSVCLESYWEGDWDGQLVEVEHDDHTHTIEVTGYTVFIDDFIYGDINGPYGALMGMVIKQGEISYVQGFDEMIHPWRKGRELSSLSRENYSLYLSLQSPAEVDYLIGEYDRGDGSGTLAVLNLSTEEWQILTEYWATELYWFSESGKTLYYQDIYGQAYKFDLALTITEPQKVTERYTGEYWDGHLYTREGEFYIRRDFGPDYQQPWFIRNLADFGDDYGYALISGLNGVVHLAKDGKYSEILRLWPSEWAADHRHCDVLDAWAVTYDGDDPDIPSLELGFLAQTYRQNGEFSLDVYRLGLKPDGEHYDAKIENIASGAYGNAYLTYDGYLYFNCEKRHTLLIRNFEEAVYTHTYEYVQGGE